MTPLDVGHGLLKGCADCVVFFLFALLLFLKPFLLLLFSFFFASFFFPLCLHCQSLSPPSKHKNSSFFFVIIVSFSPRFYAWCLSGDEVKSGGNTGFFFLYLCLGWFVSGITRQKKNEDSVSVCLKRMQFSRMFFFFLFFLLVFFEFFFLFEIICVIRFLFFSLLLYMRSWAYLEIHFHRARFLFFCISACFSYKVLLRE